MQPLTHHEILGLVGPFARRGRHVDLAATQRAERRLVFKAVDHPAAAGGLPALRESLVLENPHEGSYRLTRRVALPAPGVAPWQATLHAEGEDPGVLLRQIETVPPQRHFTLGEGFVTAMSFRVDGWSRASRSVAGNGEGAEGAEGTGGVNDAEGAQGGVIAAPRLVLTEAAAQVGELTLNLRVPRVQGVAAEVEIAAVAPGALPVVPEDLLAVIGWDWAPLHARGGTWTSRIRLRGPEPRRSAAAEARLHRTVQHLAQVLAEPPASFHERFVGARWGVAFRRGIPLLTVAGLFAGIALMPPMDLEDASPLRMVIFHLPTLLLAAAFMMQELPRFEIPPWPRRLKTAAWTMAPLEPSAPLAPLAEVAPTASVLATAPEHPR